MLFILSGCAGVSITSISQDEAKNAHKKDNSLDGYIVYHPVVVVEIIKKEVCVKKSDKGECKNSETRCSAGKPFTLPDYSKPYLVDIKSGFGKAGVEIEIKDGWMLGKVKDESDNTAILGTVEKVFGLDKAVKFMPAKDTKGDCKESGLYRVNITTEKIILEKFKLY